MIQLSEFSKLDTFTKASYVARHGKLLADSKLEGCGKRLYAVGKFYAEVLYDVRRNRTLALTPLQSVDSLEQWLKAVSLADLHLHNRD
jgi:hypothetical protein